MTTPDPFDKMDDALVHAVRQEAATGVPQYITRRPAGWLVRDRVPVIGDWWTIDGVRHHGHRRPMPYFVFHPGHNTETKP